MQFVKGNLYEKTVLKQVYHLCQTEATVFIRHRMAAFNVLVF